MENMTNEQICALAAQGDAEAMSTLWERTQGLSYMLAGRLYNRHRDRAAAVGVTLDDCRQVCYFALRDAVKDYAKKPDREQKFISFIGLHIKRHIFELLKMRTSKKEPLDYCDSLDAVLPTDEGTVILADTIADPNAVNPLDSAEQSDMAVRVLESVNALPERQRELIRRKYWSDEPFTQIAADLGISQSTAHILYKKALRKLRQDEKLQQIREDFWGSYNLYRCTGFQAFKENRMSSVELAVIRLEERLNRIKGGGADELDD